MNTSSELKLLLLVRHREDRRKPAGSDTYVGRMAVMDEKWLVEASDADLGTLASRGFPLYRISVRTDGITPDIGLVSAVKAIRPSEWIMTTFLGEIKSSLLQNRARSMLDWSMDDETADWLAKASPLLAFHALRSRHVSITPLQGRNGFRDCLQARSISNNYMHLLRGISVPISELGHESGLAFN